MNYGVYVASRRHHAPMWQLYKQKYAIISSWIDAPKTGLAANPGKAAHDAWSRTHDEVERCTHLVLYVEPVDFPIRGALVEVGLALGTRKLVAVVAPKVELTLGLRPLGDWAAHPNVCFFETVDEAFLAFEMASPVPGYYPLRLDL